MNKFYIFLLLATTMAACKSASKSYEKGRYTEAINLAIRDLQKNPDNGDRKALLQAAYKEAVAVSESRIRSLSQAAPPAYEAMYAEYRTLQDLYQTVQPYPQLARLVKATDYAAYVSTYAQKSAESFYDKGMERMGRGTRSAYREAHRYFQTALRYSDDLKIRDKMEEAYEAAVVRVVVTQDERGLYNYAAGDRYLLRDFENELMRNLRNGQRQDYTELYSELDARSRNIRPDQVIEWRLGRFELGRPYDEQQVREVAKDVVIKETQTKNDSIIKQYGRVTARVITTRRTVISRGALDVIALDSNGREQWNDQILGEHRWQSTFASYQGDDRALSDSDRSAISRAAEMAPAEEEVLREILRQLQANLVSRIRSQLSRQANYLD